jgi:hypothetical protein
MNIEFPCPESIKNMSKTENGYKCDACSKEVIDISNFSLEEKEKICSSKNICIVYRSYEAPKSNRSIKSVALALVLVFGTGLFTISNAQVSKELVKLNDSLMVCPVSKSRIIVIVNTPNGSMLSAIVIAVLPNGREEVFIRNAHGIYVLDVPTYVLGKEVEVVVTKRNKSKIELVKIESSDVTKELNFEFRGKNVSRGYVTMGCPNF